MTAILLDLDGVLYNGNVPIPGAAETVSWIRERKIPYLFLTNTTSRPRTYLVEILSEMGIDTEVSQILTPAVAASNWLRDTITGKVALFIRDVTKQEFHGLSLLDDSAETGASALVIGDLGKAWNYAILNRAFRLLVAKPSPQLIALGMTRFWRAPDGLRLDVAPFVVALEYACDTKARVFGKPAGPFFQASLDLLKVSAESTIMVGDDIHGDIDGAQKCGIKGIQVRTGKFQDHDLDQGITPYVVLDSIASLPGFIKDHSELNINI